MSGVSQDEGLRWFVGIALPSFILGVGWLVKRLAGRKSEYIQLGLVNAQAEVQYATAEQIRRATRREDENAAVAGLKDLAQGLKDDRDGWRARAIAAEKQIELFNARRKIEELED